MGNRITVRKRERERERDRSGGVGETSRLAAHAQKHFTRGLISRATGTDRRQIDLPRGISTTFAVERTEWSQGEREFRAGEKKKQTLK